MEQQQQAMESLYRCLFTTKSFRRRRRRRRTSIASIALCHFLLLLVCHGNPLASAAAMEDDLASFDSNFELGGNLEKSIAAVFSKVAYGSTTTTKRSIPDNVPPVVTTASSPILTTSHISSMTTARPKVGSGAGVGGLNLGKKLNENVDDDAPLVEVVGGRHADDVVHGDARKKHMDMLDLGLDRTLPTLASNPADTVKTNYNAGGLGSGGIPPPPPPPRHHHNRMNSTPHPPPYGASINKPGNAMNNNNWPPSYSPPSRTNYTPKLPVDFSNPFADKPTLRGTSNENQLLLSGQSAPGVDYTSHLQALSNRARQNLPPPPPPVPQQPFEKKVLNTPSNSGQSSVLVNQFNPTGAPGIQNRSHQQSGVSTNVLNIPDISRILSGSNGRKEEVHERLFLPVTVRPSIGKMHTTTVKIARNTTQQSSVAPAASPPASSSSQGTTTLRSFLGTRDGGDEAIEDNTEEIELDEQLNKNLLVLLKNNRNGDGDEEGPENGDGDGVMVEPSDKSGKELNKQFGGGDNLWSILWNFHIYLTAILFTIISVYSIFKIIFYDKLIYLFSQKFFLLIYCLIIMISLIRIYYLCYDPYNINASFNYLLNDFFLNFPQFLMTILLVLLIYYLIVKIYFNDLLMLVRGTGDWDERLGGDRGGLMMGGDEDEERGGAAPGGDQFKRITLDKKNKIVLVDGNNSNNSNEDNQTAVSDEQQQQARDEQQQGQASPDSNLDNHNFYLSANEEKQKEKELEYGFFLVYFLKNFYKKNARFFNIVLAMNVVLLLVFITLFIVFYVKLRLSLNANLLLVFVKCFVQFLNLNLILTYFHIYKKLKHVLNRFKVRIINVMNSCGPDGVGAGAGGEGTIGGDKLMGGNKMLISDSHDAHLTSSGLSGNGSSGESHGTGSDSQATYSRAILGGVGGASTNNHRGVGGAGGHDANSNTNLVQTFQRSFNRMNYLVFIKNLFNAINITIGIIMLYLLFIIINLLYFVYYYYYYYANASGRMESSDLQHNNLIFDKEKLNNIFLIKFNWLEWSYQFSNRLIELTILILFIWALNIKFVSNSKRFFGGGSGNGGNGKKGGAGHSPGHIHRDELIDNENFIMNLNMNKHHVVSYNTNNNQVEFNTNSPMMAGPAVGAMMGQPGVIMSEREEVLMDNEYENPINIYQQLANSQRGVGNGPAYYGVNKNYQGYYQEPVGMPGPGPLQQQQQQGHHHHAGMTMNPSNTTMFNSINVRNNEFRASKNLKQFKSTNSLSTNNLNSNNSCSNSTVMNNYRQQQQPQPPYHHQQQQMQMQQQQHHHHHPHGPGGGNNFYDVINPSQQGSNYYYSLRNPSSHHSMAAMGENGSDHYGEGGYGGEHGMAGAGGEGAYQARSMKKGHTANKNRTRKKKSTPGHHRQGGAVDQHQPMDQGILPGVITHENGGREGGLPPCPVDPNNFDYESEVAKRGSGNKMLVDDNGFLRFKEFEERNNDSGIIMGGAEYGEQQQQPHPGLETMGSKRIYNQRTPYHQPQMPQHQHPSSSHELNDFFGGGGVVSDSGNVLCRDN